MGLLSFIYWLLTGPRRLQATDRTVHAPIRDKVGGKIGEEWFVAATLQSKPQLARSRVAKDRES